MSSRSPAPMPPARWCLAAFLILAGCRGEGATPKPSAPAPSVAAAAETGIEAETKARPTKTAEVGRVVSPTCSDGRPLWDALFGLPMHACAAIRDGQAHLRRKFGHDVSFDPERFGAQWSKEERDAAKAACEPWLAVVGALVVPDCADGPPLDEQEGERLLTLLKAQEVVQIGYADPADRATLVTSLLEVAEVALSLGRGNTRSAAVLSIAAHSAKTADGWIPAVESEAQALRARRAALVELFPSAKHRWQVSTAVSLDAVARGKSEAKMPAFAVSAFEDGIRRARSLTCDDWQVCLDELDALHSRVRAAVDEQQWRRFFALPSGTDLDGLDPDLRTAAAAHARSEAINILRIEMKTQADALEQLRGSK